MTKKEVLTLEHYLPSADGWVALGKAIVKNVFETKYLKETKRMGTVFFFFFSILEQEVQSRVVLHLGHCVVKGNEKQTLVEG